MTIESRSEGRSVLPREEDRETAKRQPVLILSLILNYISHHHHQAIMAGMLEESKIAVG